ncbi:MAG: sulfatase-like hydrolase/transferase, partial [Verrucomicrobiales bacterium]
QTDRDARVYAAYMHMVDHQLGEIIALLKELTLDEKTLVFLCGDNGGQDYFKSDERPHGFFGPNLNPANGERFRAGKGSLYEGGLKVPYLVRWPGRINAGSVSDHLLYHPDVMPTLAEATRATCPNTDGISFLPTLTGKGGAQAQHDHLYWEYAGQKAVRQQNWKAYRRNKGDWELYNLSTDAEEQTNLAADHPERLKKLIKLTEAAHSPIRPGEIYDRKLIDKDRLQAPHQRNLSRRKAKEKAPLKKR